MNKMAQKKHAVTKSANKAKSASRLSPQTIHTIFSRLKKQRPKPTTELHFNNPFELLIAVMLSAQATDKSVNAVTPRLFQAAATPAAMVALGEEKVKTLIQTIGLFNSKARHIIKACEILVQQYQGQVPNQREALEALPGVGRKTANVILNTAFGQPTLAVDTHIFRVANRIGLAAGTTVRAVEDQLTTCIPAEFMHDAHHWLILHGRYTCKARKPECESCILQDLCLYPGRG